MKERTVFDGQLQLIDDGLGRVTDTGDLLTDCLVEDLVGLERTAGFLRLLDIETERVMS